MPVSASKSARDQALSLVAAAPDGSRRAGGSPWLRYAWEARDVMEALVRDYDQLESELFIVRCELELARAS